MQYAFRTLRKNPGFAALAVLALALGIGPNTAIFTIYNAVFLRPLPLEDPASQVRIYRKDQKGERQNLLSYRDYLYYREHNTVFSGLLAYTGSLVTVEAGPLAPQEEAERIGCAFVSANYFSLLGIKPTLGRSFLPAEDDPNAPPVVILNYGYWQRRFGGDPNLIGKTIKLNRQPATVVGIAPRGFGGLNALIDFQAWVPVAQARADLVHNRAQDSLIVRGRLKPGVTIDKAEAEMAVLAARLAQTYPETSSERSVILAQASTYLEIDPFLIQIILPVDGRGRPRTAADRLRECRQSVAGARRRPTKRDRDSPRAGRRPWPARTATAD